MRIHIHALGVMLVVMPGALIGCASTVPKPAIVDDPLRQSFAQPAAQVASKNSHSSAAAHAMMPNTDNGLEVRKWTVLDQPDRFLPAIVKHMYGSAIDPETQMRIERNGLRLAR